MTDAELVQTREWSFALSRNTGCSQPNDLIESLDALELVVELENELGIVIHDDDLPPRKQMITIGQLVRIAIEVSLRPVSRSKHA